MSTGTLVLRFGKYRGKPISDMPTSYLDYLLGWEGLMPFQKRAIHEHLKTRQDWLRMGDES